MSGVIAFPAPTQGVSEAYEKRLWSAYCDLFALHHERPDILPERVLATAFEAWRRTYLSLDLREVA